MVRPNKDHRSVITPPALCVELAKCHREAASDAPLSGRSHAVFRSEWGILCPVATSSAAVSWALGSQIAIASYLPPSL